MLKFEGWTHAIGRMFSGREMKRRVYRYMAGRGIVKRLGTPFPGDGM